VENACEGSIGIGNSISAIHGHVLQPIIKPNGDLILTYGSIEEASWVSSLIDRSIDRVSVGGSQSIYKVSMIIVIFSRVTLFAVIQDISHMPAFAVHVQSGS
jgi:hypothetical protein